MLDWRERASSGSRPTSRGCGPGRISTPSSALARARELDDVPRGCPVRVARDPAGSQGHLRYLRHADDARVADLHRPPPACRRRQRRDSPTARRARVRKARDDRVRSLVPRADDEPARRDANPGGSSSGPAAAVAAGMVPVAFATQTTGSIVRPAAFCGVVGYKPTHGLLPCVGVKAISETFDTVGVMTRTVEDAAFVVGSLSGRPLALPPELSPPRLGICLTHEWDAAAAETVAPSRRCPRCWRAPGPAPSLSRSRRRLRGSSRRRTGSGRSRSPAAWRTSTVASRT